MRTGIVIGMASCKCGPQHVLCLLSKALHQAGGIVCRRVGQRLVGQRRLHDGAASRQAAHNVSAALSGGARFTSALSNGAEWAAAQQAPAGSGRWQRNCSVQPGGEHWTAAGGEQTAFFALEAVLAARPGTWRLMAAILLPPCSAGVLCFSPVFLS